jgi:hypothetical protein
MSNTSNLIPEVWRARLGLILSVIVGVGTLAMTWKDLGPDAMKWIARVLGVLYVLSNVFGLKVPAIKAKPVVAGGVLLLALALMASACSLTTGYRGVTVTVKAGNETGKTVAAVCGEKRRACVDKHKSDIPALKACLAPCHKALTDWTTIVRPAVNTAIGAAFAALETARQAGRKDSTWVARLRPGICALASILQEWRTLMGDKAETLLNLLGTVEDVACSK